MQAVDNALEALCGVVSADKDEKRNISIASWNLSRKKQILKILQAKEEHIKMAKERERHFKKIRAKTDKRRAQEEDLKRKNA